MNDRPSRRVLVVDDDPDIVAFYRHVLEQAGYEVATAQRAAEARSAVALHPPDAVVLDVAMLEEDGLRLAGSLFEDAKTRNIPIVVVTALRSFDTGRLLMMEMDNIRQVLFKPFPPDVLVTGVNDAIRWRG